MASILSTAFSSDVSICPTFRTFTPFPPPPAQPQREGSFAIRRAPARLVCRLESPAPVRNFAGGTEVLLVKKWPQSRRRPRRRVLGESLNRSRVGLILHWSCVVLAWIRIRRMHLREDGA